MEEVAQSVLSVPAAAHYRATGGATRRSSPFRSEHKRRREDKQEKQDQGRKRQEERPLAQAHGREHETEKNDREITDPPDCRHTLQ